jgi:hypothetical protein
MAAQQARTDPMPGLQDEPAKPADGGQPEGAPVMPLVNGTSASVLAILWVDDIDS